MVFPNQNTKVIKNPHIIYRILADNMLFLYNEINQEMFCFGKIGCFIWQSIEKEITIKKLVEKSYKIFKIKSEILDFIEFLIEYNLVSSDNFSTNRVLFQKENIQSMELWRFVNKYTGRFYPVTVTWEITYNCNQSCIHCYENCDFTKNMQDMDIENIKKQLQNLKNAGCFILNITGGEPFVRKDIFEILSYAKELNFSIVLYTNSTLLTDEHIQRIKELEISKVCVTLFSLNPYSHDKIANKTGLQSKTVANILKMRDSGINIRINCPVTKYNFDGYKDVVLFAKDNNCELVVTPTMTPKDDGDMSPLEYCLSDEQFETILLDKEVIAEMEQDKEAVFNKLNSVPCNVVFSSLAISANGKVYPCNTYKLDCGDINKNSLVDIWNTSEILNKLRQTTVAQITDCKDCLKLKNCLPCPAYSWLEHKEIVGKSTISCRTGAIRTKLGL